MERESEELLNKIDQEVAAKLAEFEKVGDAAAQ